MTDKLKLIDKIQQDLTESMKAKDGDRVSVLRLLLSGLNGLEKEKKEALDDDEVLAEIISAGKRRQESIRAFREGDRQDLVDKEEMEFGILAEYLPEQLTEDEIRTLVEEVIKDTGASSMADLGKVMGQIMSKAKGKADGKIINEIVRECLSE